MLEVGRGMVVMVLVLVMMAGLGSGSVCGGVPVS